MTIISIKQAYPGHAMRAAHGALGGTAGYHGRFVIVVDDDIDPFDLEDVMWALATRCDPETSLDVCRQDLELQDRSAPAQAQKGSGRLHRRGGDHRRVPAVPLDRRISSYHQDQRGIVKSDGREVG